MKYEQNWDQYMLVKMLYLVITKIKVPFLNPELFCRLVRFGHSFAKWLLMWFVDKYKIEQEFVISSYKEDIHAWIEAT